MKPQGKDRYPELGTGPARVPVDGPVGDVADGDAHADERDSGLIFEAVGQLLPGYLFELFELTSPRIPSDTGRRRKTVLDTQDREEFVHAAPDARAP